jgi:hypothetical protein
MSSPTYTKNKYNVKRHQKNLKLINDFYEYYKTASFSETCKKFKVSNDYGAAFLRQIKSDRSSNSIKGSSDRKLTIKEKIQIIKYYSTHGINST